MTDDDTSGKRCVFMTVGLLITVVGFFGGFMQFFWMDTHDVGTILFYVLVIPMVSAVIGIAIMLYGLKDQIQPTGYGMFRPIGATSGTHKERSFIHEPPRFCKDCGANLSAESIEWVGPLTVKCPYCGATHPTEKREV